MQKFVFIAIFSAITQMAVAQEEETSRPECPKTHYPCGTDSCCSK